MTAVGGATIAPGGVKAANGPAACALAASAPGLLSAWGGKPLQCGEFPKDSLNLLCYGIASIVRVVQLLTVPVVPALPLP
jgi:hypothetical protein